MGTLVGRDAELGRLRELLDEAADGHAVAALIGGDAWVGKSRLVTEVTAIAASRGFIVLTGQCAEIGDSVPYLPFADAIRTASPEVEAAEAEYARAAGRDTPEAWESVLAAFGPQYAYETARNQWRLAAALAEAGRADVVGLNRKARQDRLHAIARAWRCASLARSTPTRSSIAVIAAMGYRAGRPRDGQLMPAALQ